MKRIILICVACMILLCGCSSNYVETEKTNQVEKNTSMFVEIETTNRWKVVYHKDTKVMYAVSYGSYNIGTFTLLVNADGTPMLYEGGD